MDVTTLHNLLAAGRDDALLRFSLGQAYLRLDDAAAAIEHLRAATVHDPNYSAAWQALGQALSAAGDDSEALLAYRQGITVAERRGDKQAAKQMTVFARRLQRQRGDEPSG